MSKMLILARKYNDIFYAISTDEWKKCSYHILIFITDRLNKGHYPLEELFNEIYSIQADGSYTNILYQIIKISCLLPKISFDYITTSNLALTANLYILSNSKTKRIILIEDGLMNYSDFCTSNALLKLMLMKILRINERKVQSKVIKSYMLCPSYATYYYGKLSPLVIDNSLFSKVINTTIPIEGKSIFVGQPIYSKRKITVAEYSKIVNDIIDKFNIDYYLPHTMSSKNEAINCASFDILKSKATLELYASMYTFKVYSFNSSVLYTTKILNPRMETFAIEIKDVVVVPKECIIDKVINNKFEY